MTREEAKQIVVNIDKAYRNFTSDEYTTLEMAIKALEQEPCEDCISREEAIKCLECDFDITGRANMEVVVNYINSAHDKIMNLPGVKQEPKTEWIPVSERLPRKGKDVLVTDCVGIDIGWIDIDANEWCFSNNCIVDEVIAWMPLPKPYREVNG